jgi:hypothetical protein
VARGYPREAPPQCVRQRRDSNPLCHGAKYPRSSPPALVEPQIRGKPNYKIILCGAIDTPLIANSEEFALPSVSGSSPRSLRQAPRAWARAFSRASPGIRVSRSGMTPGNCSMSRLRATKNPPERLAREGPHSADCRSRFTQDRSHKPGTRRLLAESHSVAASSFHNVGALRAHAGSRT